MNLAAFPVGTVVRIKQSVKHLRCSQCGGSRWLVEMDDDRTTVPCDCQTQMAKVVGHLLPLSGLVLDRHLGGYKNWNIQDVEVVLDGLAFEREDSRYLGVDHQTKV